MTRTVIGSLAIVLVASTIGAFAQSTPPQKPATDLTGKWTMNLQSPQGAMTLGLALKQDGKKLTGTWSTPHGTDVPLVGSIEEAGLTLSIPDGQGMEATFTGEVKSDGSLAGTVSSPMGDMSWSAKRVK